MSSLFSVSDLMKLQTVKYTNLGSLAILVFDYCITFSEEVRWTWFRPWDLTRIIFVISRYLTFVAVAMIAHDALRASDQCAPMPEYIIHIISILAAEALMVIRTWAFWQRSKRLLIALLVHTLLTVIAVIAVDITPTTLIPGEEPPAGCYFEDRRNSAVVYMFLAMFEAVMLLLTVYKRVHDYKNFQSGIIVTLYHDGMFYMLSILTVTLANVIIAAALPSAYSKLFHTLQLVSHSVLASRILFRLRHSNERAHEPSMSLTTFSTVNYLQPSSILTSGTSTTIGV